MLIKSISWRKTNYAERNTETTRYQQAGWNITADLNLVQAAYTSRGSCKSYISTVSCLSQLLFPKYSRAPARLISLVLYVLWRLWYLPSSFCSICPSSSVILATNYTLLGQLLPHLLQLSVPHESLTAMVSTKDPSTYTLLLISSFLVL